MAKIPIRPIDFANPADVEKRDLMVSLVDRMLTLHERKAAEKNPDTLRHLETEIAATDRRIDRLVYDLYGLTPAEIALVEDGPPENPSRALQECQPESERRSR